MRLLLILSIPGTIILHWHCGIGVGVGVGVGVDVGVGVGVGGVDSGFSSIQSRFIW